MILSSLPLNAIAELLLLWALGAATSYYFKADHSKPHVAKATLCASFLAAMVSFVVAGRYTDDLPLRMAISAGCSFLGCDIANACNSELITNLIHRFIGNRNG